MAPIELFAWPTPNGFKVSILLEELELPYIAHPIDITAGDQFKPEFLKISPNNKMPAIIDPEGPNGAPYAVFESGAILMYVAEKAGSPLWPQDMPGKYDVMQWLMFQMGGVGPMLGQAHHFRIYAPKWIDYPVQRYTNEAGRLYGVMNKRLAETAFLAGDAYSIADIATFPWTRSIEKQGHTFDDYPNLKRWYQAIDSRPAVQKGLTLLEDHQDTGPLSDKAKEIMFGASQSESD